MQVWLIYKRRSTIVWTTDEVVQVMMGDANLAELQVTKEYLRLTPEEHNSDIDIDFYAEEREVRTELY